MTENKFENLNNGIIDIVAEAIVKKEDIDREIAFINDEFKDNPADADASSEIKSLENNKNKIDNDLALTLTKDAEQFYSLLNIAKQKIFNFPYIKEKEIQDKAVKLSANLESLESRYDKSNEPEKIEVSKMLLKNYVDVLELEKEIQKSVI